MAMTSLTTDCLKLRDYWGEVVLEDGLPRSSDGQLLFLMEMVTKI